MWECGNREGKFSTASPLLSDATGLLTPDCERKMLEVTQPVLFLHLRSPVEDDRQGRRTGLVHFCVDQKSLAIAGYIIGKHVLRRNWLSQVGLKQHHGRPGFEAGSQLHWRGHHFPFGG